MLERDKMRQLGKRIDYALLLCSFFLLLISPHLSQIASNANLYPISDGEAIQVQQTIPRVAAQATNVCITEIYAYGDANEWFEIYNPTGAEVDLTNWRALDPSSGGEIIELGGNVSAYHGGSPNIYAGEIISIGDQGSGADIEMLTDGNITMGYTDELAIIDGTGNYQDVVCFGSSVVVSMQNTWYWNTANPAPDLNGLGGSYSIERVNRTLGTGQLEDNNNEMDWELITPTTRGSLPQYSLPIVISEVMYGGEGAEWIEITNNGLKNFDIGTWVLHSLGEDNQTQIPSGIILAPFDTYVVGEPLAFVDLQRNISLKDEGDVLLLKNGTLIVDTVIWGYGNETFTASGNTGWASGVNATGNLVEGNSIFRYNLTQTFVSDTNSTNDWYATTEPTPGAFYSISVGDVMFSEISMTGTTGEFIELFNNLSWPILIDGMEIWDYGANSREIQFSGNVLVSSLGVLTAGDSGSGANYIDTIDLTGEAEDLVLYRDGTRAYELDVIIYGNDPTENSYPWGVGTGWIGPENATGGLSTGYSLQRINGSDYHLLETNTSTDWEVALKTPGWISPYSPPGITGSVIITEIMMNPSTPTTGAEYIEIYNPLEVSVVIGNWRIYRASTWGGAADISLTAGLILPAKSHLCIVEDYALCVTRYNLNGLYYESPDFSLDDGPGDVILTDAYNNIMDLVAWRSSSTNYTNSIDALAWTDGGVYKGSTGKALARLYNPALNDAYVDTNSSADWRYNVYPAPGNHTNNTLFLSTPFTGTAQVRTFSSPDNSYAAIVDLWRAAKNTIDVCVYQFTSDPLLQELVAAMNRGVQVRLLLQDIYPLYDSPYVFDSTHDPDNYQTVYVATQVDNNPNGSVRWASNYFAYTHAKYFIIDGEVVAMLTENFKATGVPSNPTYGNRGWGIAINNSQLAQKYLQVYNFDWNIAQTFNPSLLITGQRDTYIPTGGYQSVGNYKTFDVTAQFQTVVAFDDPINVIVDLLDSAKKCIYIELFYLYPTWTGTLGGQNNNPFIQALIRAADRGVDVRVILDSTEYNLDGDNNNDEAAQVLLAHNVKVKWSNNSGGIEKFHVKALIVDNASVMIASLNWNENSATNNREIGVIVNSTLVAQYYVDLFFYDWVSLSTTSAPGEGDEGPEPTYTWMWWLPVTLLVFVIVLLSGYIHRLSVEGTRVRNIPHVFSPSLKESIKPTTHAEKAPIHIELAILRLKIQEIYGSAITVMQLKPYGTSTGENAPGNFIRSYVRANHEFLQVGTVVNPTPYILIFKYSPEDYIGLESTLDLRPRAFEIKSLLTSAVRETVRLEKIKARVDNMLREGN